MTSEILVTKLFIPPTTHELVSRPNLIKRLNHGYKSGNKLSLISAPAGFGKTTLVTGWLEGLTLSDAKENQREDGIAWLSLDESDNDPARFLTYMIAALRTIDANIAKGALSTLQSPRPPPAETTLTALINDIAALTVRMVLVLDDYHLIDAQPIHDALVFLLEHLPPQMHLVIATREDPHLPLSRLRSRGQLTELRAADLRFTTSEASEFLNQVMRLELSAENIAALETRTEGWVAGLQLAAISMRGHLDVTSFIQSFTGSHRLVLDYLIEEVFNQQSESVQTFLLQTSILNRVNSSLCDAVRFDTPKTAGGSEWSPRVHHENSRVILEKLEHANLFIIPLDEERRWYRYHHLFADILQQRLRRTLSEKIPILHHNASIWYEKNGLTDEAIEHALKAEDFDRAVSLIEKVTEKVWVRSEDVKFRQWLDLLPVALVLSKPRLCIFHAWHLYLDGQIEEAEHRLDAAEQVLANSNYRTNDTSPNEDRHTISPEAMQLMGRAAAVRSVLVSYRGDVQGLIHYAKQALEYLPKGDLAWRSTAIMSLGDAYDFLGEIAPAYKVRLEALELSKATGNVYMTLFASLNLVFTLRDMGQLQQVQDICEQQIEVANQNGLSQTGVVGWLLTSWGEVLAEKNELDKALQLAEKGVKLVEESKDVLMLNWSYLLLMRILYSRGELDNAGEIIQKMQQVSRQHAVYPWALNRMKAWKSRIWLAQVNVEAANQWVNELEQDIEGALSPLHNFEYFVLARVFIAQTRLDDASQLLQRLLEIAEAGEYTSRIIESLILQALTFQANGDMTQAMSKLEKALTLAEQKGFIRIFLDEGLPMAHMLYEALSRGVVPGYTRQLLVDFPMVEEERAAAPHAKESGFELIEPLSEREIEVLHFISDGLINQEIAKRLYITLNTVKVHTRNIYGKLGVNNRTQAVARAKILGILSQT